MRMSCNGCRVLRKGCTDDCTLRPSLHWIKTPESQANATVFLAKFYGRAGLINLINAGPAHLRPAIFKSLLYEACGRIINPISGSVGLMWSGHWQQCQSAVEAVLKGLPIMQVSIHDEDSAKPQPIMPLKDCDIRHLSKESGGGSLHRVRCRSRFKRNGGPCKERLEWTDDGCIRTGPSLQLFNSVWDGENKLGGKSKREPSHDSLSVETVEPSLLVKRDVYFEDNEVGLELTLGLNPMK